MHVNITFRNLDASDSLKEHARERIERVSKFLDQTGDAHLVLSLERHLHQADVTLHSGVFVLRGKDKSSDMYASIDRAVEKIERQLSRHKDKLKHHHGRSFAHHQRDALAQLKVRQNVVSLPELEARDVESSPRARVIRANERLARTMSIDDAVMQMDLIDDEFLAFTNAASGAMTVLYRRKDGHYGLIEADAGRAKLAAVS